jgi:hypothetical protein
MYTDLFKGVDFDAGTNLSHKEGTFDEMNKLWEDI